MKYEILFEASGNGVWTRHESLDSSEKHIRLLSGMTPISDRREVRWSISCQGQEIKNNKPQNNKPQK